ncbi:insulin-like peptide receptor [Tubulanus polymorphus]|uniref:insulin-like peptide receptor n=1 Tax=Tubulanus polymorphus TaxID=672921 RepID=UPI003DA35B56
MKTTYFQCVFNILCIYGISLARVDFVNASNEFSSAIVHSEQRKSLKERNDKTICSDVIIGNTVTDFEKLRNCRVIEGFLKILLIDTATSEDFDNLRFPNLIEITDYVLLFRVYGLKSLRALLPNLTVIRGHNLFFNYALVAYEMPDLEDLGLYSLTAILRGAVRLEKNPKLCYVDTLDWDLITNVAQSDHFFVQNRDVDECVNICPKTGCQIRRLSTDIVQSRSVCWSSYNCQKVCPEKCSSNRYCHVDTNIHLCCDEQCVGGCTGPKQTDCVACKHVYYQGRCLTRCPYGTYEFKQVRCLSESECMRKHTKKYPWKLVVGKCVLDCPSGYTEDDRNPKKCKKCEGRCPKVCSGAKIDNIAAAQRLKGCTVINGMLDIQLKGGQNIVKELEESLGKIEEVTGYVKIARSFALVSLNFLKKLHTIHGVIKENNKKINRMIVSDFRYALFVIDNQNLLDIWNFTTHPKLKIGAGSSVLFQLNRKLCRNKIDVLINQLGLKDTITPEDISSNGDLVACDMKGINLQLVHKYSNMLLFTWTNYRNPDQRQLLGYVLHYREAPEKNMTIFSGRDACGTEVWKTQDVRADNDKTADKLATLLTDLKPWTQYAIYVETYTTAMANEGAMSELIYVKTLPESPTHPRDLNVEMKNPGELYVTWSPPRHPNGNVTHYFVYWAPQQIEAAEFDKRDYCVDKLRFPTQKSSVVVMRENKKNETTNDGGQTQCGKQPKDIHLEEQEVMSQIAFEDFLQSDVYRKRPTNMTLQGGKNNPKRRHRRSNLAMPADVANATMETYPNTTYNPKVKRPASAKQDYLAVIVYNRLSVVIPNLKHFQEYSIEVVACQEYEPTKDTKYCSNRAIITATTLPNYKADNIDQRNITISNNSNDQGVLIRWNDPLHPNGLILSYEIEYRQLNIGNIKPTVICIPHKQYRKKRGYKLSNLPPGNYTYRIRATSLAGNGSWTQQLNFYIRNPLKSDDKFWKEEIIALVSTAVLLIIVLVGGFSFWYFARKRSHQRIPGILYSSVNPEYMRTGGYQYIADEWEIDREKVKLIQELGQGSFGMVYEGIAKNLTQDEELTKVAVKTVNLNATSQERNDFLIEASVMKAFKCSHVVKLLGVCSIGEPTLVVMELMPNGDLKNFLRLHRPDELQENNGKVPPSLKQILQMAGEIADGMGYLATQKFVHRDLAARNCMVADDLTCKIGDFGMTRDIYETDYYKKAGKGPLPVRWMSPESLRDGVFSSQSDVWSYGVVLWEMATLAAQPYQGLTNEQVLKYVIDGNLMKKPEGCPDKLFSLMTLCWQIRPKQRPTFDEIVEYLIPDLNETFVKRSHFFSDDNVREEDNGDATEQRDDGDKYGDYVDDLDATAAVETTPLQSPTHVGSQVVLRDKNNRRKSIPVDHVILRDTKDCSSILIVDEQQQTPRGDDAEPSPKNRRDCVHLEPDENCECAVNPGSPASAATARPHKSSSNSHLHATAMNSNHGNGLSSDDSKGSTKSSHSYLNGGVMNGHMKMPKSTKC